MMEPAQGIDTRWLLVAAGLVAACANLLVMLDYMA
jgi:hypothetical protein